MFPFWILTIVFRNSDIKIHFAALYGFGYAKFLCV